MPSFTAQPYVAIGDLVRVLPSVRVNVGALVMLDVVDEAGREDVRLPRVTSRSVTATQAPCRANEMAVCCPMPADLQALR